MTSDSFNLALTTLASFFVSELFSSSTSLPLSAHRVSPSVQTHKPSIALSIGRHIRRSSRSPHPYKLQHSSEVKAIIQHAWKPSTRRAYSIAVRQFVDYCYVNAIPNHEALPASETLLCDFASSFSGRVAGRTVSAKCDAIRAWHIENGYAYQGGLQLEYVIKGIENLRPQSSFRPKRPPVSREMLSCIEKSLDLSLPSDRCILFVAFACFWGQIRLGEILPISDRKFDSLLYPTWGDLKPPTTSAGSRVLHLPNTKMGGKRGEDVILTKQDHLDPINALTLHYMANYNNTSQSIATFRTPSNSTAILTQRLFLGRLNTILKQHSFSIITGHCFRIGGTTYLLLAGIPPDIVKILGRWTSDAFLRYWRHLEIIAPLYIEFLTPILHKAGFLLPTASKGVIGSVDAR